MTSKHETSVVIGLKTTLTKTHARVQTDGTESSLTIFKLTPVHFKILIFVTFVLNTVAKEVIVLILFEVTFLNCQRI